MASGPFTKCISCPNKLPFADGHSRCLYCLGEAHQPASCSACKNFTKPALRQRVLRLRAYLMEKSLNPAMSQPEHTSEEVVTTHKAQKKAKAKSSKHRDASATRASSKASSKSSKKSTASTPTRTSEPTEPRARGHQSATLRSISEDDDPLPGRSTPPSPFYAQYSGWADTSAEVTAVLQSHSPLHSNAAMATEMDSASMIGQQVASASSRHRSSTPENAQDAETVPASQSRRKETASRPTRPQDHRPLQAEQEVRHQRSPPRARGRSPGRITRPRHSAERSPARPRDQRATEQHRPRQAAHRSPSSTPSPFLRRHRDEASPGSTPSPPRHRGLARATTRKRSSLESEDFVIIPRHRLHKARGSTGYAYYVSASSPSPSPPPTRRRREETPPVADRPKAARKHKRNRQPQPAQPSGSKRPRTDNTSSVRAKTTYTGPDPTGNTAPSTSSGQTSGARRQVAPPVRAQDEYAQSSSDYDSEAPSSAEEEPYDSPPREPGDDSDPTPTPSEEFKSYAKLIKRIANALHLNVRQPSSSDSDEVFDHSEIDQSQPLAIGFIKPLFKLIKKAWAKPSSAQQMPKRTEAYFRTEGEGTDLLIGHPLPNSLIVNITQNKAKFRSAAAPSDREGRKLDTIGKRFFSLTTFVLRAANYAAAMGAYHRNIWDKLLPLLQLLPEEPLKQANALHKEAMALAKQQRVAAKHTTDAGARQLATAIALRRHAWLRSASLPEDARTYLEDLPFDGKGLFDPKSDEILNDQQKLRRTAKSYSAQGSQGSFRPYKPQWRKPYYKRNYNNYQNQAGQDRRSPFQQPTFTPRQQFRNRKRPFRRADRRPNQNF